MPAFSLLPKPSALLPLLLAAAFLPPAFVQAEEEAAKDQPPAPVERPAVSERSQDEAKGLERQLPEDGQQILKAGDESFLTLWLPANTAEAEGVVILVPGDGESPDWPQAIGPLRRKPRLQASIDLALQHEPKSVVLLGHGTGAYWAARYLAEKEPAEIHNLLLVAAEVPRDFRPALEDMVPKLKLATGDFYYRDARADREAARLRMQAGKRQKHPAYVQIAMQALPADPKAEQEQLYRRIRGWLSLHLQADAQKPAE
nr:alpha/beta hydrolase family protein [Pseudomonas aeruginosa]